MGRRGAGSWEMVVQDHGAGVPGPQPGSDPHLSGIPAGKNPGGHGPHMFLGSCEGVVSKQGQRPLLRSRSLWRVLRRRGGIDRAALERRVREAMDADPPPYHPTRSNCVHFALRLLRPGPSLDLLQRDRSPISVSAVQLLLYPHRTPPASGAG